jgi:hypothetical protein
VSLTINLPQFLLCAAIFLTVVGIVVAMIFPSKSQYLGDGLGCAGVAIFLLGILVWCVVFGLWIAGAFSVGEA